jgi:hypothetical protein
VLDIITAVGSATNVTAMINDSAAPLDEDSLINMRRIDIIRNPKLQISKNPFIHEFYFAKRKMKLKPLFAARNGEEMLKS